MASPFSEGSHNQAERVFKARLERLSTASQESTRAAIENMPNTEEGRAILERLEDNPLEIQRYGASIAFNQLSSSFKSLFSVEFDEPSLIAAGARLTHTVRTHLTPQAREREYEKFFGSLFLQFMTPEKKATLGDSVAELKAYTFSDGSIIGVVELDPAAYALNQAVLDGVGDYAQLVSDKGSRVSELADAFEAMSDQIRHKRPEDFLRLGPADLRSILERFCFDTVKSVLSVRRSAFSVRDATALASLSEQKHAEAGQWKPGVSIFVDGVQAPTPDAMLNALGGERLMDIGAALARLRSVGLANAKARRDSDSSAPPPPLA